MDSELTILVAEDDSNDRKLLHLALQKNQRPVEVRDVTDGTEVVEYLKGEGQFRDRKVFPFPDLLIIDLKMPKMDGLQVIKWLRKESAFAHIPITMLSGSGLANDVAEAYRSGVNSYLRKPEEFKDLVHKVGLLLDYWMMVEKPGSEPKTNL